MTDWISVNDELPGSGEEVYIKTDCEECPINHATFFKKDGFIVTVISLCKNHFEKEFEGYDQQPMICCPFEKEDEAKRNYASRITHWRPKPKINLDI